MARDAMAAQVLGKAILEALGEDPTGVIAIEFSLDMRRWEPVEFTIRRETGRRGDGGVLCVAESLVRYFRPTVGGAPTQQPFKFVT